MLSSSSGKQFPCRTEVERIAPEVTALIEPILVKLRNEEAVSSNNIIEAYTAVWNYSIQKPPFNASQAMYDYFVEIVENWLANLSMPAILLDDLKTLTPDAIATFLSIHSKFKQFYSCLRRVFGYLDRYHTYHHGLEDLRSFGWRRFVAEKAGEIGSSIVDVILQNLQLLREGKSSLIDPVMLKQSLIAIKDLDESMLTEYKLSFVKKCLEEFKAIFQSQVNKIIVENLDVEQYLQEMTRSVAREKKFLELVYMDKPMETKIQKLALECFYLDQAHFIINSLKFRQHLKEKREDDVVSAFQFVLRCTGDDDATLPLIKILQEDILISVRDTFCDDLSRVYDQFIALTEIYLNLITKIGLTRVETALMETFNEIITKSVALRVKVSEFLLDSSSSLEINNLLERFDRGVNVKESLVSIILEAGTEILVNAKSLTRPLSRDSKASVVTKLIELFEKWTVEANGISRAVRTSALKECLLVCFEVNDDSLNKQACVVFKNNISATSMLLEHVLHLMAQEMRVFLASPNIDDESTDLLAEGSPLLVIGKRYIKAVLQLDKQFVCVPEARYYYCVYLSALAICTVVEIEMKAIFEFTNTPPDPVAATNSFCSLYRKLKKMSQHGFKNMFLIWNSVIKKMGELLIENTQYREILKSALGQEVAFRISSNELEAGASFEEMVKILFSIDEAKVSLFCDGRCQREHRHGRCQREHRLPSRFSYDQDDLEPRFRSSQHLIYDHRDPNDICGSCQHCRRGFDDPSEHLHRLPSRFSYDQDDLEPRFRSSQHLIYDHRDPNDICGSCQHFRRGFDDPSEHFNVYFEREYGYSCSSATSLLSAFEMSFNRDPYHRIQERFTAVQSKYLVSENSGGFNGFIHGSLLFDIVKRSLSDQGALAMSSVFLDSQEESLVFRLTHLHARFSHVTKNISSKAGRDAMVRSLSQGCRAHISGDRAEQITESIKNIFRDTQNARRFIPQIYKTFKDFDSEQDSLAVKILISAFKQQLLSEVLTVFEQSSEEQLLMSSFSEVLNKYWGWIDVQEEPLVENALVEVFHQSIFVKEANLERFEGLLKSLVRSSSSEKTDEKLSFIYNSFLALDRAQSKARYVDFGAILIKILKMVIQEKGSVIIDEMQLGPRELQSDLRSVENLHSLLMEFQKKIADVFYNDGRFLKAKRNSFETLLKSQIGSALFSDFFCSIVDQLLRAETPQQGIEEKIQKIVELCAYLPDRDVFIENYRIRLGKRLINQLSSLSLEGLVIENLKARFPTLYTRSVETMLVDYRLSQSIQEAFDRSAQGGDTLPVKGFSCSVLTSGIWSNSSLQLNPNVPVELMACMNRFQQFYSSVESNRQRKLAWCHSMGQAVVKGTFHISYDFQVTTLQMLALMLFNGSPTLSFLQVQERLGLDVEIVKRILHSLSCQKLHVLNKLPESNRVEESDMFEVNGSFGAKQRKLRFRMPSLEVGVNETQIERNREVSVFKIIMYFFSSTNVDIPVSC